MFYDIGPCLFYLKIANTCALPETRWGWTGRDYWPNGNPPNDAQSK